MKKVGIGAAVLAGFIAVVSVVSSQPPRGSGGPPGRPPRFELGRVLPPPLVEELDLTAEQRAEIAKLEKEVFARLSKILTAEQKKKVENFRPRGPGGPPSRPPRPHPEDGGEPRRLEKSGKEEARSSGGIQWFSTWKSGLAEAQRSGRPILLVSAAPHCAGVSGIW